MLTQLIGHFTYPGVFLVLLVSGMGVPIPEELPIAIAAMMARWEVMRWQGALLACVGGALAGDVLLYWFGRHFGRRILRWSTVRRVLTPARELRIMEAYRRHGLKFLVVARLVMGLRSAAFLTAGLVRVPFLWFLLVDLVAVCVSVPLTFGVAYAVADSVAVALAHVRAVQLWIAGAVLLIAAVWLVVLLRRRQRDQARQPGRR
jgi:membrane protein DedA with SNARE-associated domain